MSESRLSTRAAPPLRVLAAAIAIGLTTACGAETGDETGDEAGPGPATLATLPEPAQAISLLGDTLRPSVSPDAESQLIANLAEAQAAYDAAPEDADAIIWLGRRLGYLQEYRDAIDVFSRGIEIHPGDARMYRHRGHRYISIREFGRAIDDYAHAAALIEGKADRIEPDGQPNERGIPTSTLQSNIWYHYGLAQYLTGDFEDALESYRRYLQITTNPDQLVAISHWHYMALRRLGRDAEAAAVLEPITADLDVIENTSYHDLLLMYGDEIEPESLWGGQEDALGSATVGYGVANWHYYNGREEEALEAFRQVLRTGQWASFGYIAAEAELARLGESR